MSVTWMSWDWEDEEEVVMREVAALAWR